MKQSWIEALNIFYERYLLRDFLAKILPGMFLVIVLMFNLGENPLAIASFLCRECSSLGGHFSALVLIGLGVGLLWGVGMAMQGIFQHVFGLWSSNPAGNKQDSSGPSYYDLVFNLLNNPKFNFAARSQRERLCVIKEFYGNLGLALICAAVLAPLVMFLETNNPVCHIFLERWKYLPFEVLAGLMLLRAHLRQGDEEWHYLKAIQNRKDRGKKR